jgi:hypothetical protein
MIVPACGAINSVDASAVPIVGRQFSGRQQIYRASPINIRDIAMVHIGQLLTHAKSLSQKYKIQRNTIEPTHYR